MLLDDDVVTDRQPQPRTLAGGLGREERIEYLFLHLGRNAGAVVADADLHAVAEATCRGGKGRLETVAGLRLARGRCVEAVQDQVQQHPRDVLRENVGLAGGRIERSLEGDIEVLLLGTRAVIGEVEAFLDKGVDIDKPVLARSLRASAAACS